MRPDDVPYLCIFIALVGVLVGSVWGYCGGRAQESRRWREAAWHDGLVESDGQHFGVWPARRPLPDESEEPEC